MSEIPQVGAFAIVPSNDLAAAIPFWERLGFARAGGDANYILAGFIRCVHLEVPFPSSSRRTRAQE
jgi:hypothetical protein